MAAQPGLTQEIVELASGIDALYCSGRAVIAEPLLVRLADGRAAAEELSAPVAFDVGGEEFAIAPHGFGRYRFCLVHPHGQIGVSPSGRLPTFRIQPRAEFLHGVGPRVVVAWFRACLENECGEVELTVSRLDLFCDVEGFAMTGSDRRRFCCRATKCRTNEDGGVLTGFEFGQRTSRTICARLYDKTKELKDHGSGYVAELWGDRHNEGAQVWRMEFEIGRVALAQFGIDAPEKAIERAGELWNYSASDWLTERLVTGDETKSRWPIDPTWRTIQQASLANDAHGATRLYARSRATLVERLLPGLFGYLSSFAALVGTSGISDTCSSLAEIMHRFERDSGWSFVERVAMKHRRAALA